jgi:hypothetical protein
MNSKWSIGIIVLGLAVVAVKAPAQERVTEVTPTQVAPQEPLENGGVAAVDTAPMMAYQGSLEKAGVPIDGQSIYVELSAYTALAGGTKRGETVPQLIPGSDVHRGSFTFYFNAALLALPDNADETYLEVAACSPGPCTPVALAPRSRVGRTALAMSAASLAGVAGPSANGALVVASSAGAEAGVLRAQNVNAGVTSELKLDASAGAITTARSNDAPIPLALRSERAASFTELALDDFTGEMTLTRLEQTATAASRTTTMAFGLNHAIRAGSSDGPAPLSIESLAPDGAKTLMLLDDATSSVTFSKEFAAAGTAGLTPPPKLVVSLDGGAVAMSALAGPNAANLNFEYGGQAAMTIGEDPEAPGQAIMMVAPPGIMFSTAPLASAQGVAALPSPYFRQQVTATFAGDSAQGNAALVGGPTLQIQSVSNNVATNLMEIASDTGKATFFSDMQAARVLVSAAVANTAGPSSVVELSVSGDTLSLKVDNDTVDRWTAVGATAFGNAPNRIGGSPSNLVDPGFYGCGILSGGGSSESNHCVSDICTIAGGISNEAGSISVVGGGRGNRAGGTDEATRYATVGGGWNNTALGGRSTTVGGGESNTASGLGSAVAGGRGNIASGADGTVGGGGGNTASGISSTVGGGASNNALAEFATIAGGGPSYISDPLNTNNRVYDNYGTVGGGGGNRAGSDDAVPSNSHYATIAGGQDNRALAQYATVGGGAFNAASGEGTVGGGRGNTASGDYRATVGGGYLNTASGRSSTVAGGESNTASGGAATVAGGVNNTASGDVTPTVGGGSENTASGRFDTVGGGYQNTASGTAAVNAATVAGGTDNTASAQYATVAGGASNLATAHSSIVPGGELNQAGGEVSLAAGQRAKVRDATAVGGGDTDGDQGTFMWADATNADFISDGPNKFLVRASGGTTIYSDTGLTAGVTLAAGGGSWSSVSDKNLKENFADIDKEALLEKLSAIPVTTWNYKSQDSSIRHIGPMGQDFHTAFGVGETDTRLSTIDVDGVALAAIQGLYEIVREKDCEVVELGSEISNLQSEISELKALVHKLAAQNGGGR